MSPKLKGAILQWGYFLILLAICLSLWLSMAAEGLARFETKAWDFLSLYTGASMVLHGRGASLYDLAAQIAWQNALITPYHVPGGGLPFYYPPLVLPFVLPFALAPLTAGYFLWMGWSGALLAGIFLLLQAQLRLGRLERVTLLLGMLSFYPLSVHLMQGQTGLLVLLGLTLGYVLLRREREFWAGLALSLVAIKPQLLLPLLLVLLARRRWSALAGLLGGGAALVVATLPLLGLSGYLDYFRLALSSAGWRQVYGVFPEAMHNFRALAFRLLGPALVGNLLLAGLMLLALGVLIWVWWGPWRPAGPRFPLQFAATVLLTTLLSPHLNLHDLVLWLLPGALLAYAAPSLTRTGQVGRSLLLLGGSAAPLLAMLLPGLVTPPTVLLAAAGVWFCLAQLHREPPLISDHGSTET